MVVIQRSQKKKFKENRACLLLFHKIYSNFKKIYQSWYFSTIKKYVILLM